MGCVLQGSTTLALACCNSLMPILVLRALNGFMLASLRPVAYGIIADTTSENRRGKTFSFISVSMNIGMMVGGLVGTPLSRSQMYGIEGWRVAFVVIGSSSIVVSFATLLLMTEPPREKPRVEHSAKEELLRFVSYFQLPTFCVLVLQGCFGGVPWAALSYATIFFQVGGLKDYEAGIVQAVSQISGAVGCVLGGMIADALAKRMPIHGRPAAAQFSVLSGIPVACLLYLQPPPAEMAVQYYTGLMVVLGLLATWCGTGVNLPILSQIVSPGERSTIMAWEGALEGSCSAIFANAAVGVLAQNVFGFDLTAIREGQRQDPKSTQALGYALFCVSVFPWTLCFLAYTLLHWSFPRDLRRVQQAQSEGRELRTAGAEEKGSREDASCLVDDQYNLSARPAPRRTSAKISPT